jgi:outer membrane receptor for ferrienterochelin and colicins
MMKAFQGVAALALLGASPVLAQEQPPKESAPAPRSTIASAAASRGEGQVYTTEDFQRYAPRNANDMLVQVPGFSIRDSEQLRGLGQASGNVLFNGQRPSTKSDDLFALLSRIPASNVERIEILDGASLDIPGLSGQVANIVYEADTFSGQFSWSPEYRAHFADPLLTRGDLSISGRFGSIEYEVGLNNDEARRSAAGGPTLIYDALANVIETREDVWTSNYDAPKLSAKLTWDAPGSGVGHLNGHYQRIYNPYEEEGSRFAPGLPDQLRTVLEDYDTWNYEVGGDYEFALGPGRLKAIGLRSFSHEPYLEQVVAAFADSSPSTGDRFTQTGNLAETIGRAEYTWAMLGSDWQLSGEAAFNTLDNVAGLFTLEPTGQFTPVPLPGSSGGVSEDRYEVLLSVGAPLSPTLSLQIVAGAEKSTISQTASDGITRTFLRPKGSLTLAWQSSSNFDVSVKLRRRVLQLSFYDFLATANLNDDNQNEGNTELRPQQDWSFEAEANHKLGRWGSTKVQLIFRDVEDYVDIIPVGNGEAVGNIPKSWAGAVVWDSTINLDPAGIRGMKLETSFVFQKSQLRDPFTNEFRQWSGFGDTQIDASLRHDVPDTNWAWGAEASYSHNQPNYRSRSVDRIWEGPTFASVFAEHKDVLGLTVRAEVRNVLNARSRRYRTVYTGLRGQAPILSVEDRDRLIGPIFSLSMRGSF